MHNWLGRMPWAFTWVLFSGIAFGVPPSADQLCCWIRQLDSHDFTVCAEASRNLSTAGDVALEALLARAGNAAPEAAWRAASVLQQIALHGNEDVLRRVIAGLEQLSQRGKPGFDGILKQLQTRQARLQRERAVATIRSLGGRFEGDEKGAPPSITNSAAKSPGADGALEPPPEIPASQPVASIEQSLPTGVGFIGDAYVSPELISGPEIKEPELALTIDENWRGGDAGLAALLELGSIRSLRIQRAPLTDAALDQLAVLPQLQSVAVECCWFSAEALDRLRQRQPHMQIIVQGK